ncbi:unnamed protein product [Lactuca saligna]|uniref:Uncharacterized protein n=1 Tax=Lactuca saligna TaxID=75948 RepID=A0AA35Y0B5_LACSI|nr:unnamed protein product [Lactuca saligna]
MNSSDLPVISPTPVGNRSFFLPPFLIQTFCSFSYFLRSSSPQPSNPPSPLYPYLYSNVSLIRMSNRMCPHATNKLPRKRVLESSTPTTESALRLFDSIITGAGHSTSTTEESPETNISVVYRFHCTHEISPTMPSKQPALSPSCITQFETEEILKMSSNQPPKSVVLQPYVLLGKQINVVDRQIQGRLPRLLSEGLHRFLCSCLTSGGEHALDLLSNETHLILSDGSQKQAIEFTGIYFSTFVVDFAPSNHQNWNCTVCHQ